jgi:hypothetical protein
MSKSVDKVCDRLQTAIEKSEEKRASNVSFPRRSAERSLRALRAHSERHRNGYFVQKEGTNDVPEDSDLDDDSASGSALSVAPVSTEVQRLRAELATLRAENEELKTGSALRTLGTPLSETSEPSSAKEVVIAIKFLIEHPTYLRIATTQSLLSVLRGVVTYLVDDGLRTIEPFNDDLKAVHVLEELDDIGHGPDAGRLWSEVYDHSLRAWIKDLATNPAPSKAESQNDSSSESDEEKTVATGKEVALAGTQGPDDIQEPETTLQEPTPGRTESPDSELVLTQEPLGPVHEKRAGEDLESTIPKLRQTEPTLRELQQIHIQHSEVTPATRLLLEQATPKYDSAGRRQRGPRRWKNVLVGPDESPAEASGSAPT